MKRVKTLGEKRNILAHGNINDAGKLPFEFWLDKEDGELGINFGKREKFQLSNVAGWSKAMEVIRKDILDWITKTQPYMHASPKMHRAPQNDPTA